MSMKPRSEQSPRRAIMRRLGFLPLLMGLTVSMPMAHERQKMTPRAEAKVELSQSIRPSDPECYCWANGQRFGHGEQACIKGGGMTRLALCDRVLNVMSWSFSAEPCPES
ncbi:MAG: hypothetical protein ACRCWO_00995 [Bosea sp. (in: a-proteobacteria)]